MQDLYQKATVALQNGNWVKTEKMAHELIKQNAQDDRAWNLLGMVALQQQSYQQALDYFQKALAINPQLAIYHNHIANIYRRLGILAAQEGVSMEEEARRILTRAVSAPERLSDIFRKYFGKKQGVNLKLAPRKPHEPMDFNE